SAAIHRRSPKRTGFLPAPPRHYNTWGRPKTTCHARIRCVRATQDRTRRPFFRLEELVMAPLVQGVVRNGVIVPRSPLPEGARVEIRICETDDVPPELRAEFDAWDLASASALELVERLAAEGDPDATR